jgi:hypothetical protein
VSGAVARGAQLTRKGHGHPPSPRQRAVLVYVAQAYADGRVPTIAELTAHFVPSAHGKTNQAMNDTLTALETRGLVVPGPRYTVQRPTTEGWRVAGIDEKHGSQSK